MPGTYTLGYHVVARNMSVVNMVALWQSIAADLAPAELGFAAGADNTAAGTPPDGVDRTIVWTGAPGQSAVFESLNTSIFRQGLNAFVLADPVVET